MHGSIPHYFSALPHSFPLVAWRWGLHCLRWRCRVCSYVTGKYAGLTLCSRQHLAGRWPSKADSWHRGSSVLIPRTLDCSVIAACQQIMWQTLLLDVIVSCQIAFWDILRHLHACTSLVLDEMWKVLWSRYGCEQDDENCFFRCLIIHTKSADGVLWIYSHKLHFYCCRFCLCLVKVVTVHFLGFCGSIFLSSAATGEPSNRGGDGCEGEGCGFSENSGIFSIRQANGGALPAHDQTSGYRWFREKDINTTAMHRWQFQHQILMRIYAACRHVGVVIKVFIYI